MWYTTMMGKVISGMEKVMSNSEVDEGRKGAPGKILWEDSLALKRSAVSR